MRAVEVNHTIICPKCGNKVPADETCWIHDGRFYCTEACVRAAVGHR